MQPFGLSPDFPGERWIAVEGDSELTLGHGDPASDRSALVLVGVVVMPTEDARTIDIHDTLGTRLALGEAESQLQAVSADPDALQRATEEALATAPAAEDWSTTRLQFDGQDVEFLCVTLGRGKVAARSLGDRWVYVQSHRIQPETLQIVPITDLDPYRTGPPFDCD